MKLIHVVSPAVLLTCLPMAARAAACPESGSAGMDGKPRPKSQDCDSKGCPRLDQNGMPPVSCAYQSSMATGYQCIVICTYANSSWGTTVDSSNCN